MRECIKCFISKPEDLFRKKRKDCRECESRAAKEWQSNNKEKVKLNEKIYRERNKERLKEKNAKYYKENLEYFRSKKKEWQENNKSDIIEYGKKYAQENKEKIKKYQREYSNNKYRTDEIHRLKVNYRTRMSVYCKVSGFKKGALVNALGCSWEEFKIYIESKWTEGMSWDNYKIKGWHIDHIIPLSHAKTEEDVKKLFHYTNLQPLWWIDNLKKSNKIIDDKS
jgi:hypothetical protein